MARSVRARTERLRSEALLLRRVPFGEADLVVSLFTERSGVVSAVARGGRRSSKRFSALEPMHLLRVSIDERPGAELGQLAEASIERPRLHLVTDLARLEAAGRALRWVREIAPAHTAEPPVFAELNRLLDRLDDPGAPLLPDAWLVTAGLHLLSAFGWGIELGQCVRCGRACDLAAASYADPARGGLVCRACGGGPLLLRADLRARLVAATEGDLASLRADDVRAALDLVEGALAAHASGG
ncbi:MAG: DNA repair protein RecO [Polyangiaceae bacterium]|nr:DNA repair protein RecO [Polyangiaceae bacterium]